jgi:hypothetical protein
MNQQSPRRFLPNVRDEAVRGWRVWRLGTYEPRAPHRAQEIFLRSCVFGDYWPASEPIRARCRQHAHPVLTCECGIYAVASREQAVEWAYWALEHVPNPFVIGEVQLWGRVLQYTEGYRAEYAYPLGIRIWDEGLRGELDAETVMRQLRADYVVDVMRA